MSAGACRELILAAATRPSPSRATAATTTDSVARRPESASHMSCGCSAPSSSSSSRSSSTPLRGSSRAFARELDAQPFDPTSPTMDPPRPRLQGARRGPGLPARDAARLHVGRVDEIGVAARACMGRIFAVLRRTEAPTSSCVPWSRTGCSSTCWSPCAPRAPGRRRSARRPDGLRHAGVPRPEYSATTALVLGWSSPASCGRRRRRACRAARR